jgi:ATP-binding cassette subfamily C protein CydCD
MRPSDPRLRRQLAPARGHLLRVGVWGVLGSLLLIAQAWAVTMLVLAVLGHRSASGSPTAWALAVAGIFLARGLAGWASDVAAARAAGVVGRDLRRRVLGVVFGRGPGAAGSSGSLTALATRGVTAAEPYLTRYVPALVLAGVLPVLTVVAIAVVDPPSALIVLVTLPLIPVFGILVGLATQDRATSQWRALADLSGHFLDVMRGLPTLVAFRRARAQSSVIAAVTDRYRRRTLRTLRIAFASSAVLELVATISVALVAVTVGIRLASGHVSLRTALVVLLLAPEAYWPLRRVGAEFHAAAEGVATFEAAAALPPGGRTFTSAAPRAGASHPTHAEEHVRAVEVAVSYAGRTVPALQPVSLDIAPKGVTAIVGPSGCGKSTLLAVLAGRLAPSTGQLEAPPEEQVALLPQRPVFVAGSIAANLRLARPDATDHELWAVLHRVALADRVAGLAKGLEADLDEDGRSLSAGERARLALARVVLADRPWVLLDEPTAHLDATTERVVAETVTALGRERAVVVVAHRPALVELADRVIALSASGALTAAEAAPRVARVNAVGQASLRAGSSLTGAPATAAPARRPPVRHASPAAAAPVRRPPVHPTPSEETDRAGRRGGRLSGWGAAVVSGLAWSCGVALTATAGWLIVRADARPAILTLTVAMVGVRTFGLGRPVLRYVERLWSHDRALRLLARRRVEVYDALVPLVPGRLGKRRGDVLAAVVDDVDAVLDRELRVLLPIRAYAVTAALTIVTAALIRPEAAVVVTLTAGAAVVAALLTRVGATQAERATVAARARLSDDVVEAVHAADELRMWQAERVAVDRVDAHGAALAATSTRTAAWLGGARALVLAVAGLGVAATALLLRHQVATHELSGPIFAFLLLLPLALAEPAAQLAEAGAAAARAAAAERRLDDLVALRPAVSEPERPAPGPAGSAIGFSGVAARGRRLPDVTLAAGERVALVGPSGSGKSTVAALALRFLDPDSGEVSLAGTDYRTLAADTVRERVGLVDDDPHVFASTVAENVRLARPGSSDGDVEDALRRAHLGAWLDALPEGLATRLGDGYAAVSGGERARLAVARSLLADQQVLVLDEPTAHLDAATAQALATDVLTTEERGIVWITHAPHGLDLVDRVVRLGEEADATAAR